MSQLRCQGRGGPRLCAQIKSDCYTPHDIKGGCFGIALRFRSFQRWCCHVPSTPSYQERMASRRFECSRQSPRGSAADTSLLLEAYRPLQRHDAVSRDQTDHLRGCGLLSGASGGGKLAGVTMWALGLHGWRLRLFISLGIPPQTTTPRPRGETTMNSLSNCYPRTFL